MRMSTQYLAAFLVGTVLVLANVFMAYIGVLESFGPEADGLIRAHRSISYSIAFLWVAFAPLCYITFGNHD